jgi:hypothetical protein
MTHSKDSATTPLNDARTTARQAIVQLRDEWQTAAQQTFLDIPTAAPPPTRPVDYDPTDLKQVCAWGDLSALQDIINQGVAFFRPDDATPFYIAAQCGQTALVRFLLDTKAYIDPSLETALITAANQGHSETVALLLDRGANLHAEKDDALHWAAYRHHADTMALLIDRGAPVEKLTPEQCLLYDAYQNEQAQLRHLTLVKNEIQDSAPQSLADIFNVKTWVGHTRAMTELWSQVPEPLQNRFDFSHALNKVTIQTMKQRKAKITLVK